MSLLSLRQLPVEARQLWYGRTEHFPNLGVMIQRDGPIAPWRQIAQIFRDRIESGDLALGARLPSIASIAQEYEVAGTTAQKVIEALKAEGLVTTSLMGIFVSRMK